MTKKVNPFDQKYTHQRFSVLNDKRKVNGRPAHARERAQEIRRKTLLPQMKQRGKVGALTDRRFGSRLPGAEGDEQVQVERFKAERLRGLGKRASRRSIFNLGNDDEDEDELGLTHGGKAVGDLEDEELLDEEMNGGEEEEADYEGYEEPSFGGFDDEPEDEGRRKSKAEVMSEVIAKSKRFKAERQKLAQENAELIEQLDSDLATIRASLAKRDEDEYRQEKAALNKTDFDEAVRLMTFDRRVQPADRTKTAEEIHKEAMEKRREALKAAAKRQSGDVEGEEDDGAEKDQEEEEEMEESYAHFTFLLEQFDQDPQDSYAKMVQAAQGKEAVLLGKAIRAKLGKLMEEGTPSLYGARPAPPSLSVCLMLQAIGRIYSTGDRHHVIVTPAALVIGLYLQRMRITTAKHLQTALFLAQVALDYARPAKRYVPEVLNLIEHVLCAFHGQQGGSLPRTIRLEKELKMAVDLPSPEPLPIGLADLTAKTVSAERLMSASINLLTEAAQLWAGQVAFAEMFQPSLELLQAMPSQMSSPINLLSSLIRPALAKRTSLRLQQHKPIPLPLLTPALDQPRRDEAAILKRAIKLEAKGARRELLRDTRFLADQQRTQRAEQTERYQQMLRKIEGTIANDGANISFGGDHNKKKKRKR